MSWPQFKISIPQTNDSFLASTPTLHHGIPLLLGTSGSRGLNFIVNAGFRLNCAFFLAAELAFGRAFRFQSLEIGYIGVVGFGELGFWLQSWVSSSWNPASKTINWIMHCILIKKSDCHNIFIETGFSFSWNFDSAKKIAIFEKLILKLYEECIQFDIASHPVHKFLPRT